MTTQEYTATQGVTPLPPFADPSNPVQFLRVLKDMLRSAARSPWCDDEDAFRHLIAAWSAVDRAATALGKVSVQLPLPLGEVHRDGK